MKARRRAAALVALVLVAAAGGLAWAGYLSLVMLNLPAPVIAAGDAGALAELAPASPGRLLVVVVDGLGHDAAARVPEIAALGGRGAWVELLAEPPTFSSA